ncbi:putative pyrroline-5-carboxylate reductase [Pestalotiopsis sp. NC0098]|nr:putative pyrroline-5-carboxylate reductase [Pestalotiopsis sp. NC0098]
MASLCILGCGNLGTAILGNLIQSATENGSGAPVKRFFASVRSERSEKRLTEQFSASQHLLEISRGSDGTVKAATESDVILLGVDPADVDQTLRQPGLAAAMENKLVISIVAGWTREQLVTLLASQGASKVHIVRTLPNMAATVSQSITAIENPDPATPSHMVDLTDKIMSSIGKTVRLDASKMDAFTAVGGSTPAFFAVIVDSLVDAAVAVGLPRHEATSIIAQSMLGSATLIQSGVHPGVLRDQGTSPEGCTMGGLMVMEERNVRGGLSRALREAVTVARLMGKEPHVNDTRRHRES